ncbi:MAG: membrane protein insertase YidC [Nitrospira sp.]|nr:membrane protein insertase YidC [Nitrospira sp.]
MEKRVLIAIVLSVLVLIGYQYLAPAPPPQPKSQQAAQPVQNPAESSPISQTEALPLSGKMPGEEKTITVETDLYKAVFTNRGGVIKHWELKKYWLDLKKQNKVVLFDQGDKVVGTYPMSVTLSDPGLNNIFKDGLFSVEGRDVVLNSNNPKAGLSFSYVDPQSRKGVKKTFTFYNDSYHVDVDIIPVNTAGNYTISTGSNFGISEWGEERIVGFVGPSTMVGTKVIRDKVKKITGPIYHEGDIKWASVQDKYFISALIPRDKINRVIIKKAADKDIQSEIEVPGGKRSSFILYAGPKEYKRLKSFGVGLDHSISFGWFIVWEVSAISWMARGLFSILQFFYNISHNYGIAIIFLTAIVRVVFTPLTYKSYKSMKGMQKLQPEIQKLQKKYKDNRGELNKAMMELYKTHKVNPLGGCLPMVLQLPVFIGLYNLLANTIELRQSPFFLWVQDLSTKDPYYVMPIIMGITMLVQQKMTPTTVDPTQAKMMLIMPVIFTFFFLNFPSGLVLYWMVNNILTIGQQHFTMKYFTK